MPGSIQLPDIRTLSRASYRKPAETRRAIIRSALYVLCCQVTMLFLLMLLVMINKTYYPKSRLSKRWGGFPTNPTTDKCYRQERTAMLLNLFLGCLAVDQWYAHHWVLATFKMLAGLGLGSLVIGNSAHMVTPFGTWWLVDQVLWMVGGVYGTPGCPGGYHGY